MVRAWYGTGHGAARIDRPLAGKTGSTNGNRDAWFVGFSPEIVAGVWVGHDDMASLGPRETGGRAALPIWTDFMEFALSSRPPREFPRPEGVVFGHVDPETGEASESPVAFPGWTPLAAGRKLRRSTYVAPPAEPEPAVAEAHDALMLPAVAAPPP